jgi:predicted dehydrogenase
MLNIVVVGPGLMGKQHIERILQMDILKLCAVVAPDSAKNKAYSDSLGVPMYGSLRR